MNPSFIVLAVAILVKLGSMEGQSKREVLDVLTEKSDAPML
jgi:hypothetical protein